MLTFDLVMLPPFSGCQGISQRLSVLHDLTLGIGLIKCLYSVHMDSFMSSHPSILYFDQAHTLQTRMFCPL